jgi:hypothetical protein
VSASTDQESQEALGFFDHLAQSEASGQQLIAILNSINELTKEVSEKTQIRTEQLASLKDKGEVSAVAIQRVATGLGHDMIDYAANVETQLTKYRVAWSAFRDAVSGATSTFGKRFGPPREDLEHLQETMRELRPKMTETEKSTRGARVGVGGNRGIARSLNEAIAKTERVLDRLAGEYAATNDDLGDLIAQVDLVVAREDASPTEGST